MRLLNSKAKESWEKGISALDPHVLIHSFYFFPAHLQHLVGITQQEGFIFLQQDVKKDFLNHLDEICFNIVWDFQNPTPVFVQFIDAQNYWIGFPLIAKDIPEFSKRIGYWNVSKLNETFWCEIYSSKEFKLHRNPIKSIPQSGMTKVIWDTSYEGEEDA